VIRSDSFLPVVADGTAAADEFVSMKPKNSLFDVGVAAGVSVGVGVVSPPNSTKPSRFVGTTMFCFGTLMTPRLWSSRTSIILFFFLKIIIR